MRFTLAGSDDFKSITVLEEDTYELYQATNAHPNFDRILEAVNNNDPRVFELFDMGKAIAKRFERLSERVTVAHGEVFFDGDAIDNALTRQVVRFVNEGVDDYKPLVLFFENVMANPSEHSRENLYRWLMDKDITISDKGTIVAYKGVARRGDGYTSINTSGSAIVNGETHSGAIPYAVGDLVEMPRSDVAFDPAVGCSTGLHIGNFRYAESFALGGIMRVEVNPRDVVSVPTDSNNEKLRACRFKVLELVEQEDTSPVYYSSPPAWSDDDHDPDWEAICSECGDDLDAYDGDPCNQCLDDAENALLDEAEDNVKDDNANQSWWRRTFGA